MFCTTECWICEDKNCKNYISKQKLFFDNQLLKSVLDEIRDNLQKSIDSINDKLSDKEIRVENGIIVNPINDYRIVRLKAIRMKCKELLQILDKVEDL